MRFPLYISRRLSLSSGGRKSAPAVKVAVIAVALSVAVMLASVAIVNGFKDEIKQKVIGFNSHITLYVPAEQNESGDNLITLTPTLRQILDDEPYIVSYSLETSVPAVFKTADNFKGIYYRGLTPTADTLFLHNNLEQGRIPGLGGKSGDNYEVAISGIASRELGITVGDTIDTYFISDDVRVRPLVVTGVYNSHFDNYDDVFVYGPSEMLGEVTQLDKGQGTTIKVTTDNFDNIEENSLLLNFRLQQAYAKGEIFKPLAVENARQSGVQYFSWLSLLDMNVIVILILMTIVASATLIGGMLILILDKTRFIGLMKSLGANNTTISRIFILLSLKVAAWGMLIGNALMLGVLMIQDKTHFLKLDPDAYYIDFVPTSLSVWDILILNGGVLAVIVLILWLPSRYVSRISPSETLRNL